MNHKFYSVNVSNSNIKRKEIGLSSDFIQEKELKEIYDTQYNDIFPKILSKTKTEFITLLKEQVSLHLKIINKKLQNSLNSKLLEYFSNKFFIDKNKATKGLEELIKNPEVQENYLSLINCFIHCHKCSTILHKCKKKIILYKNLIYCLHCQKVYNENQIKLYCQECKTCYYTKLRHIINKRYENFYPVSFLAYHCNLEEQEKMQCLECGNDLYYNITYEQKNDRKNTIKEVFCLKCKLLYDLNEIYFKCKICKSDFKSEARLYSSFSFSKIHFLLIMHCLRKKKFAIPEININRKCKCDISKYEKYLHQNDNGILYLGHNLEGQYIIICDGCYSKFKYNEFLWNCPICGINFKSKKIKSEIKRERTVIELWNLKKDKKENNQAIFKSPSHMNIGKKHIIGNYPTSPNLIKNKKNNNHIVNNHIVNNLFKRNNTKFNNSNNNKNNNKTKVIIIKDNVNSEKKLNLNLSDKKINLFKRINNINNKNDNNYNSVNYNYKQIDLRKQDSKNKNNSSLNSLLNNISFSNMKSESNTNKCTDSTANITVSEKINEWNNMVCRSPSCLFENKKSFIDNNNIKRQLLIEDFIEKDKKSIYNKKNEANKTYIKKSKTCMEKECNGKKDINNKVIKRIESIDNLKLNRKIINENKKETKIYKMEENNKIITKPTDEQNHENVVVKITNKSVLNKNLIARDSSFLDLKDNDKNMNSELNSPIYNSSKIVKSKSKIKIIKKVNIDSILDSKVKNENIRTEYHSINNKINRDLNIKNKININKSVINKNGDNIILDSKDNNKNEFHSINYDDKNLNSKNRIKNIKSIQNINVDINVDDFIVNSKQNDKKIITEIKSFDYNIDKKMIIAKNKLKNLKKINVNKINNKNKNVIKRKKDDKNIIKNNIKHIVNINNNINTDINNPIKEPKQIFEIDKEKDIEINKEINKDINKEINEKKLSEINKIEDISNQLPECNNKDLSKSNNEKGDNINYNNGNNKSNLILDKIKKYYEESINEEKILLKNSPKKIIRGKSQNKNNINSPKKKLDFKNNFNSDNYKSLKLLGKGTFGKTYLVEDIRTKERYALKKININNKLELKENQDEYDLILKITKEYPDLKVINIYGVEIKNLDQYNTVMYVLMEAANYDWEKEIIKRCTTHEFYKENQLMKILKDLVKTFAILQKNGISHRDVKPQNILCFSGNEYKISDFGEAKNMKNNFVNQNINNDYDENTMKQTLRGTELYMSPILFHALRARSYHFVKYNSYKSDVFSLGMCFFLASSLDYEGLYEVREIKAYPKKTKFVVNRYLNMKYSQKYINLLISMLQINEKDRPDFIELEKIIEKY